MKKVLYITCLFLGTAVQAQTALYNTGNLRIHENGQMGFHTDLINDGLFDENLGLVGFYGDPALQVSGNLNPSFFDAEFVVQNGTVLNTTVNILNNANFISGNVTTPRTQPSTTLNFEPNGFYTGAGDISKVDGYASLNSQQNFTFPVGDATQLRPLILNSEAINPIANCAYFFENPNSPSSFSGSFSTGSKPTVLREISAREFWRLEGSVFSTVQISWNERSEIGLLTDDIGEIVLVGWSKSSNQWVSLGGSAVGDFTQGMATSESFMPDDYEVLTFGATGVPRDVLDLDNYMVSPNGDGINDFLEIPELAQSPNNHMRIYDRNGLLVFEQINYTNEFNGFATENNFVINRDKGLPSGVYFYIVSMDDLDLDFQGFLYLAND
ncbi:MAG: gliding motility-associated C-terminal domain-containing protein [Pricia sp.]|nr:gliding motility-associated C-terminal domain-containing protein [Pricia sp.]